MIVERALQRQGQSHQELVFPSVNWSQSSVRNGVIGLCRARSAASIELKLTLTVNANFEMSTDGNPTE